MIGPSFESELKTAGLQGLPFSWSEDGSFYFNDAMTQEQRDAVLAVYAAHDPQRPAPKMQRIAAKLQSGSFPTKGHLFYFIENMRTVAALDLGITKEQAHAAGYSGNPMYRQMVDLYNEILAIEAEP